VAPRVKVVNQSPHRARARTRARVRRDERRLRRRVRLRQTLLQVPHALLQPRRWRRGFTRVRSSNKPREGGAGAAAVGDRHNASVD
jgi:hypothetical protein